MTTQNRRKDEDTRDLVIETKTALEVHTEADSLHFQEIKETFAIINHKLDKIGRSQIFVAGILATLMFLMNYPQLMKTIEPPAQAEGTHGR